MTTERAWGDFLTVAEGRLPNHVPVALSADCGFIASALEMNVLDFFMYPDRWLNAYLTLIARFPDVVFLPGFWVEYGIAAEPSAFGASVFWRYDQAPAIRPLHLPPLAWADLPRPDPYSDGLMALVVRRYWNLEQKGELPEPYRIHFVAARGPFTTATHVLGANEFLAALAEPDAESLVEETLDIFTDTTIRFLQAQLGCLRNPLGVVVLDDTIGMLTPQLYTRFAKPALDRIFRAFDGMIRVFHIDTPCEPLLPYLPHLNFEVFHFSHLMDIRVVKAALSPRTAVMGNVPPLGLMVHGTPDEVEAAARACIERAAAGGGLILAPGGGTNVGTPAANIDALVRATRS
jgi:uroporphyrinogen-III decarboxylase